MKQVPRGCKIFMIVLAILFFTIVIVLLITASLVTKSPTATVDQSIDQSAASGYNATDRVIIVGAGSAGLFAAYTLSYLGVDYQLLEASSDIGGRVQELAAGDFADVPLDLGAEWIHVHPRILQDLLLFDDTVDVRTMKYQPQTIWTYPNEKRVVNNWIRFFYREHKFYDSTWYSYLKDYVHPYVADRLTLDSPVASIDYSNPDQVTVRTTDGRVFTGSQVIVATPVTILQDGDIEFNPPLPTAKVAALDRVYMTAGLKAWIEFDERFYPDWQMTTGLTTFLSADTALYFDAVFGKPSEKNILALFHVGGEEAYDRVALDDDDIIKGVLDELDKIFDGKATQHFVQSYVLNWSARPYIRGAYSYNDYDMKELLKPIDKRVYFCGEYLSYENQATVHGAAISGRNAAKRLVADNSS